MPLHLTDSQQLENLPKPSRADCLSALSHTGHAFEGNGIVKSIFHVLLADAGS